MIRHALRLLAELIWLDWQLVGTFQTEVKHGTSRYNTHTYNAFIHCFETRWGTRFTRVRIQKARTFFGYDKRELKKKVRRAELYQTKIYPWKNGRWVEDIPTFHKVEGGKWDFLKKLKGETPVVLNDDEE